MLGLIESVYASGSRGIVARNDDEIGKMIDSQVSVTKDGNISQIEVTSDRRQHREIDKFFPMGRMDAPCSVGCAAVEDGSPAYGAMCEIQRFVGMLVQDGVVPY